MLRFKHVIDYLIKIPQKPASSSHAGPAFISKTLRNHRKWTTRPTNRKFFTPTIYGIQDACALLGCQYQWTGSQKNVVSEMVDAVQTAVAEKADGIAVCLVDPKAFDAAVDAASDAGIPVIAFNADVPMGSPNKRLA